MALVQVIDLVWLLVMIQETISVNILEEEIESNAPDGCGELSINMSTLDRKGCIIPDELSAPCMAARVVKEL